MLHTGETKFRLYVDEVGNSDLRASSDPNHRYLSLTGVILELGYVRSVLFPELEHLKRRFFGSHPDDPVVLHRRELVNKRPPFSSLQDPKTESDFNAELLDRLTDWVYVVITVIVDKHRHNQLYPLWKRDPYHYGLQILVEQFVLWLSTVHATGDVMAEARGKREDMRLKASFGQVMAVGSEFVTVDQFHSHLSSIQLKVKPKTNNIAGLQLADLVAHPSLRGAIARRNNQALPANFGGRIAALLEERKYHHSPSGAISGWGVNWLP